MTMEFFAGMLYRDEMQYAFYMTLAGGTGALFMGLYFVFAMKLKHPFRRLLVYTLTGTAAGAVFGLCPLYVRPSAVSQWAETAALLFVIWQSSTAACLAEG